MFESDIHCFCQILIINQYGISKEKTYGCERRSQDYHHLACTKTSFHTNDTFITI